ncbi:MAG TPA: hypothetical protein VGA73_17075 [Candidatus Binatia bacterium]
MAGKGDDLEDEIDATKRRIEGASTAMTEKLELLDERLRETVQKLKRNFDIRYQIAQYPWPIFTSSILIGFLLGRRKRRPPSIAETATRYAGRAREALPAAQAKLGAVIQDSLKGELSAIKGLAVGAVIRTVFGMLRQALTYRSSESRAARGRHNGGGPVEKRF